MDADPEWAITLLDMDGYLMEEDEEIMCLCKRLAEDQELGNLEWKKSSGYDAEHPNTRVRSGCSI
jgi:hypothetical protein